MSAQAVSDSHGRGCDARVRLQNECMQLDAYSFRVRRGARGCQPPAGVSQDVVALECVIIESRVATSELRVVTS